ncbi:hypothetical protein D3C78_1064600 [compost metagenome]
MRRTYGEGSQFTKLGTRRSFLQLYAVAQQLINADRLVKRQMCHAAPAGANDHMIISTKSVSPKHALYQCRTILRNNTEMISLLVIDALRQSNLNISCAALAASALQLAILCYRSEVGTIIFGNRAARQAANELYAERTAFLLWNCRFLQAQMAKHLNPQICCPFLNLLLEISACIGLPAYGKPHRPLLGQQLVN